VIKSEAHGWGSAYTIGFLAGSAIAFGVFVVRMRRARQPLLPPSLFRSLSLDVGVVLSLAVAFSLFGVLFFLTLYLQRVQGYSPVGAGVRMLPLTAVISISAPLGGVLGGKVPLRLQLFVGLLIVAGGLLGLIGIEPDSSFTAIWPWFILLGIGMGLVMTGSTEAIVGAAPVERAGIASGLQQTGFQVGGALGTSVLGAVLTARIGALIAGKLAANGVPAATAAQVAGQKQAIAQGLIPVPAGTSHAVALRVVAAGQQALTDGMHVTFVVAAGVAVVAALLALLFVRGESGAAGRLLVAG
jgi:predicted MFS family arabinose efflux permease